MNMRILTGYNVIDLYKITEDELLSLMKYGGISPRNALGKKLSSSAVEEILKHEFDKIVEHVYTNSPSSMTSSPEWVRAKLRGADQRALMKAIKMFCYAQHEVESALSVLYPNVLLSYKTLNGIHDEPNNFEYDDLYNTDTDLETQAQQQNQAQAQTQSQIVNVNVSGFSDSDITKLINEHFAQDTPPPTQNETSNKGREFYVAEWANVLLELKGSELMAARIAIQKWLGKTHEEVFKVVRPGDKVEDPKNYISKMKKTAEEIAEKYGLTMPDWTAK